MKKIEHYAYNNERILGKGSSGIVYLGENQKTKDQVAIKVIDLNQIKDEYTLNLINTEIDIMRKLNCENIVHLIDVFQT